MDFTAPPAFKVQLRQTCRGADWRGVAVFFKIGGQVNGEALSEVGRAKSIFPPLRTRHLAGVGVDANGTALGTGAKRVR